MKKLLSLMLAVVLCAGLLAGCGEEKPVETSTEAAAEVAFGFDETKELAQSGVVNTVAKDVTGELKNIKIGVILIGDETEGYTEAHILGIENACKALGLDPKDSNNVVWKYKIEESDACTTAAEDLVAQGCSLIITNSYGHQYYVAPVAEKYPSVSFVSMTGDTAAADGYDNFSNAFTSVYESRYVSGVVAGMKIKELVEAGKLTDANKQDGKVKIGYVGAYPYAEVVSGYTAFFLGVQSVYKDVVMDVQYTSSWYDLDGENEAAKLLIGRGCVVIGQHADSVGAPTACEAALKEGTVVYSVGYNIDMLGAAPNAALTSATNDWSVYYEYAIKSVMTGAKVATNWAGGYNQGAVAITTLGPNVAAGTQAAVDSAIAALKAGTLHVFDTSKFTVGGKNVSYAYASDTNGNFVADTNNVIADGYFHESYVQSAPAFSLRIDGITELNANG